MGTIKQGILGGFSGKVGTVIGGSWKGIQYMRSLATNVKNPRTEKQMSQRSKFAITLEFLKPITPYVRVGFKNYANKQTAFNAGMSYNVANAISGDYPDFSFDFSKALVSRGSLTPAENGAVAVTTEKVTITWNDNSLIGNASATDLAMPLIINSDKGEAVFSTASAPRSAATTELNIPADWIGDNVHAYLAFASEDGKNISNSIYLGQDTIA